MPATGCPAAIATQAKTANPMSLTMSTPALEEIDDLRSLFLRDVPLLDVRAPVEFAEGAFPNAVNHPLIDDLERERIGLTYKQQGQDQAIALGIQLVSGDLKEQRIRAWEAFMCEHPDAVLYCFRGGMRSQISQRWLHEHVGIACPRVRGGYKAMRRYLIDQLQVNAAQCRPVVIGGRTGVGKTRLLRRFVERLDLEQLAHHRGSAFGGHPQPQPTQIDFENALSIALLKRVADGNRWFVVEDESRNIGSRHIPEAFFRRLEEAPIVVLEASEEERIEITLQEYVHDTLDAFRRLHGEAKGFAEWRTYLLHSVDRIRRRLGGDRHLKVRHMLEDAIDTQQASGATDRHRAWIAYLLREYYDGMYSYQLAQKSQRVEFSGPADAVMAFLSQRHAIGDVATVQNESAAR